MHRAQHFSGDGALIARMTEGGKWLVQNELFSQALVEGTYQLGHPFHLRALEILNLLACLGGIWSLRILLRFSQRMHGGTEWPLLLFFSSGFFVYACGHTEYYPLFLPFLLLYGDWGVRYLRKEQTITSVTILFVLGCGVHFAMLIALPSLLILPAIRKQRHDWGSIALWLVLLIPLVLIRNFPQILGHKAAGLSPAWNFLPWFQEDAFGRYYAFFQWGHWADWLYVWARGSWIFLPLILLVIHREGWRFCLYGERLFLLTYAAAFLAWTTVWHPDLGIEADWDLFAIAAAPYLMLAIQILPFWRRRKGLSTAVAMACLASFFVQYSAILMKEDLPRHGYGSLEIHTPATESVVFTLNGAHSNLSIPRLRAGCYAGKLIDRKQRSVRDMNIVIQADRITHIAN